MLRQLPIILVLTALPLGASAQSTFDGSIYSAFGVGETYTFSSSQSHGMGTLGAAMASPNYLNLSNPATWGSQVLTRFIASADYQQTFETDADANRSQLQAGALGTIALSFPLVSGRLSFLAGFQPYSRVGYRVRIEDRLTPAPGDTLPYIIDHKGSGGIQRVTAGVGWRVGNTLSVGASVDAYFGLIEAGHETNFLTGEAYLPARISNITRASGFSGTVGGLFFASGVFSENDALGIGASVSLPVTMSGEQVRTSGLMLDRDTLHAPVRGNMTMPLRATGGIAYSPSNRWLLAVDGRYEPWSQFSTDFALGQAMAPEAHYRDRVRIGAGAEFIPAGARPDAPYLSRVAYRLGGYAEQSYFNLSNGQTGGSDLNTYAIAAGMSFPTVLGGTRFDLNLEAGTRGTTESNLVRDLFYRVTATINFGERWFVKRRLN